jgi:hypothetical protein
LILIEPGSTAGIRGKPAGDQFAYRPFRLGRQFFSLQKQLGHRYVEDASRCDDRGDGGAPLAPLDPPDVVAMDSRLKAQLFLRKAAIRPKVPKRFPESFENTIRLCHIDDPFSPPPSGATA